MAAPATPSATATWIRPGAGMTGSFDFDSDSLRLYVSVCAGICLNSVLELIVAMLMTFHHYRGNFFWSLLAAGAGTVLYSIGFLLRYLHITAGHNRFIHQTLLQLGSLLMITGQSYVMWSRLRFVLRNPQAASILRWTRIMIIATVFLLHVPMTVLAFGRSATKSTPRGPAFARAFSVFEKIQMTGFFVQEGILSVLYIVSTLGRLKQSPAPLKVRTRSMLKHVLGVNYFFIAVNIILLVLEFVSMYILETPLKAVFYSVKLKMEFAVLSKLGIQMGDRGRKERPEDLMDNFPGWIPTATNNSLSTARGGLGSPKSDSNWLG
ncbi:hypothetical protein K470DRAFT_218767 [Piedraia hortae CBS 480.64]|uniref:DUF7703 domain-containing protein n=1 Tax=Piedraia hortae CBS 480.64 TaxID=1314780 RepID=A0A6A7BX55_9PEZI|nr:hypothetical protein K470DRAFT_218767 [Piedraia hortae CBS 480.64]